MPSPPFRFGWRAAQQAAQPAAQQVAQAARQATSGGTGDFLAKAVVAPVVGAGVTLGALHMYDKHRREGGIGTDFDRVSKEIPEVVRRDPEFARKAYASLHQLAPDAARDPLIAASFIRTMVERKTLTPDTAGIDLNTAKLMAELDRGRSGAGKTVESMVATDLGKGVAAGIR